MMEHKGYRAAVTFDGAAGVFHGEVLDTRSTWRIAADLSAEGMIHEHPKLCRARASLTEPT